MSVFQQVPILLADEIIVLLQQTPGGLEGIIIRLIELAFQTNNILAMLLAGAGIWFGRCAWPDIVSIWKQREETRRVQIAQQDEIELRRIEREAANDQLLMQQFVAMTETTRLIAGAVQGNKALLQSQGAVLIHILDRIGGGKAIESVIAEINSNR